MSGLLEADFGKIRFGHSASPVNLSSGIALDGQLCRLGFGSCRPLLPLPVVPAIPLFTYQGRARCRFLRHRGHHAVLVDDGELRQSADKIFGKRAAMALP